MVAGLHFLHYFSFTGNPVLHLANGRRLAPKKRSAECLHTVHHMSSTIAGHWSLKAFHIQDIMASITIVMVQIVTMLLVFASISCFLGDSDEQFQQFYLKLNTNLIGCWQN